MHHSNFEPADPSSATDQQRALVNAAFAGQVPEVWIDLAELNFVALRVVPALETLSDETLALMAVNLVHQLASSFGGGALYIPMGMKFFKGNKNALIASEFNGANIRQLARKHSISDMRVRQIIQEQADLKKSARPATTSSN
jgi:Mor family transcriptional regulator